MQAPTLARGRLSNNTDKARARGAAEAPLGIRGGTLIHPWTDEQKSWPLLRFVVATRRRSWLTRGSAARRAAAAASGVTCWNASEWARLAQVEEARALQSSEAWQLKEMLMRKASQAASKKRMNTLLRSRSGESGKTPSRGAARARAAGDGAYPAAGWRKRGRRRQPSPRRKSSQLRLRLPRHHTHLSPMEAVGAACSGNMLPVPRVWSAEKLARAEMKRRRGNRSRSAGSSGPQRPLQIRPAMDSRQAGGCCAESRERRCS